MYKKSKLKLFLEIPGILELMLRFSEEQEKGTSSQHWIRKVTEPGKLAFAIDLYNDDFEINEPLGSNADITL